MIPIVTLIMSGTNVAIIRFGGHYISEGTLEVGNLIAFMTYAMQILMSFMMMSMMFVFIPRAQASAKRINEVLDMEENIQDDTQTEVIPASPTSLSFDHVDYRYKGAEKLALQDVNFSMTAGSNVSDYWRNGFGKSTLVNLIPRFYDVESEVLKLMGLM